jgi:hypothetical protein
VRITIEIAGGKLIFSAQLPYLALIPEHFEPAHEPYWTGVGRDLEARENFFWLEPSPKCCF